MTAGCCSSPATTLPEVHSASGVLLPARRGETREVVTAWRHRSCSAAWAPGPASMCGASGWTRGASGCGATGGRVGGARDGSAGLPARSRPLGGAPRAPAALWRRSGSSPGVSPDVSLCSSLPPQVIRGSGGPPENLDFFGSKERAPLGSVGKQEDGAGRKDVEMAGKRKRTAESGKRKRKKRQGIYVYM